MTVFNPDEAGARFGAAAVIFDLDGTLIDTVWKLNERLIPPA